MNIGILNKEALLDALEKAKYLNSKEYRDKSAELMGKIMRGELLPEKIEIKKDIKHPFDKFKNKPTKV